MDAQRPSETGRVGSPAGIAESCRGGGDRLPGATLRADDGCTRLPEREPAAEGADGRGRAGNPDAAGSGTAERFVSSVLPNGRRAARTRLMEARVIEGWVRGLSDRDIERLVSEAARGVSKSAASQICRQLRARDQAFRARGLGETGWSSGSWTPPTCPPGPPVPRRACWWPGAMTRPGTECSWMRCWASGNDTSAGDGPRPSRRGLRAPMLVVTDPDQPRRTRRSGTWAGLRSPAVYRAPTLEPGCHAAKEGCPAAPAGGGGLLGSAG
jgi:hypothetical protein